MAQSFDINDPDYDPHWLPVNLGYGREVDRYVPSAPPDQPGGGGGRGGWWQSVREPWTRQVGGTAGNPNLLGVVDLLANPNFQRIWEQYNPTKGLAGSSDDFWGMPFNKLITSTGNDGKGFLWSTDASALAPLLPGYRAPTTVNGFRDVLTQYFGKNKYVGDPNNPEDPLPMPWLPPVPGGGGGSPPEAVNPNRW